MFTIIQNFFGEHAALKDISGPCHAAFAQKRGYQFQVNMAAPPNNWSLAWAKIPLLSAWADQAATGDEAVWLDARALICRDESLSGVCAGRDLAMKRLAVGSFQWYTTEVLFVRKRSDRLKAFFDSILANGPMGRDEELPVSPNGEKGRLNSLLSSGGMNVQPLSADYCSDILSSSANPIIRTFCSQGVVEAMSQIKSLSGWRL